MKIINMHQAKTHLSKLVKRVQEGEEIVIAKAGKPLIRLVSFEIEKKKRQPGSWSNKVKIAPDFDKLPPKFLSYFK